MSTSGTRPGDRPPPADDADKDEDRPLGQELLLFKLRYKQPDGDVSKLLKQRVTDPGRDYSQASNDFKFASSVASFGMLLRRSEYKGNATFASVLELAGASQGDNPSVYRKEFLDLVRKAQQLSSPQ